MNMAFVSTILKLGHFLEDDIVHVGPEFIDKSLVLVNVYLLINVGFAAENIVHPD